MISLLPIKRYRVVSEVSPAQFAALLDARARSDPTPPHSRARFQEGITVDGFEISRVGIRRNLFHTRIRGRFEPLERGSSLLIEIRQFSLHIYLTVLLGFAIILLPVISRLIAGETTLEYEARFIPDRPLAYLALLLFFPAVALAFNLLLSWVLFPWELRKSRKYLTEVLELDLQPTDRNQVQ